MGRILGKRPRQLQSANLLWREAGVEVPRGALRGLTPLSGAFWVRTEGTIIWLQRQHASLLSGHSAATLQQDEIFH